jgi:hypothetical protein
MQKLGTNPAFKSSMKKHNKAEPKSSGTKIAEKARAKANFFTDEKRKTLLDQGVAIIRGGCKKEN